MGQRRSLRTGTVAAVLGVTSAGALGTTVAHGPATADDRGNRPRHVLLISVDGMHAADLARYVRTHPHSTLADLSRHGTTYSSAVTSKPSDSFPGILAPTTGGSPNSTGVWYDNSYDRRLAPPAAGALAGTCTAGQFPGTNVLYDESIEFNNTAPDGGGGGGIDPAKLPRDPAKNCAPVYPHQYLRVNTIFNVAHEAGLRTAWADKHFAYDLLRGPDGRGLDDLFTPEITSVPNTVPAVIGNDQRKVDAILNEIDGHDHTGAGSFGEPAIFGMNFQSLNVAQKDGKTGHGGYTDALFTPGTEIAQTLDFVDTSLSRMTSELRRQGHASDTVVIVEAKHGQSPVDPARRQALDDGPYTDIANSVEPGNAAQVTTDDIGMVWLRDQSKTTATALKLAGPDGASLQIDKLLEGDSLRDEFNDPATDPRVPDIIALPRYGVIYTGGSKIAEHGGFGVDDTSVALLVSRPGMASSTVASPVETTQIAPTILSILGLDPYSLQAVVREHTAPLPALRLGGGDD